MTVVASPFMRQYVSSTLRRVYGDINALGKRLEPASTKASRRQIEREVNASLVTLRTAIMHVDQEDVKVFAYQAVDPMWSAREKGTGVDVVFYLDETECRKRCDELNDKDGHKDWAPQRIEVKREWEPGE